MRFAPRELDIAVPHGPLRLQNPATDGHPARLPAVGEEALLIRSQGNTVDLMRLEASLQADEVVERCCGFYTLLSHAHASALPDAKEENYPRPPAEEAAPGGGEDAETRERKIETTTEKNVLSTSGRVRVDALAGCVRRHVRILHSGQDYRALLRNMDDAASGGAARDMAVTLNHISGAVEDGCTKRQKTDSGTTSTQTAGSNNFSLDYEQSQRCSELEQTPFVPGVSTAVRFTQEVFKRLSAKAVGSRTSSAERRRSFVIVDYKDFVCLAEDLTPVFSPSPFEDERNTELESRTGGHSTTLSTAANNMPVIGIWDRFFARWSRSGKPWSFSASIDPYVAQAALNLLLYVDGCLRRNEPVPERFRTCLGDSDDPVVARLRNMCTKRGAAAAASDEIEKCNQAVALSCEKPSDVSRSARPLLEYSEGEGELPSTTLAHIRQASGTRNHGPATLLDCCCGSGTISAVACTGGRFKRIIATDKNADFLARARSNIEFVATDPTPTPAARTTESKPEVVFRQHDWIANGALAGNPDEEQNVDETERANLVPPCPFGGSVSSAASTAAPATAVTIPSLQLGDVLRSQNLLVVANTPWGRRFGGEGDACGVMRGIVEQVGDRARAIAFFVPPRSLELAKEILDLHVCVPLGKPALFLIGSRKK